MTRNDDELTKLRRAFAAPGTTAQPAGCPEPDRIWEAVRGELPSGEVREIVNHAAVCSSCAEDWRIAMSFEEESRAAEAGETDDAGTPPNVIRPPASRFRPWMAAAAAALVVTVAGIQMQMSPAKPPVYRSGSGSAVEARAAASAPRDRFVLGWRPAAGAESYELLVTTSELAIVANPEDLTATEYQVPASALAGVPGGGRLFWTVTAVFPDGSRQQSPTLTTVLEQGPLPRSGE